MSKISLPITDYFQSQKSQLNWWPSPATSLPINTFIKKIPLQHRRVAKMAGLDLSNLVRLPQDTATEIPDLNLISYLHTQAIRLRFEPASKAFENALPRVSSLEAFNKRRDWLRKNPAKLFEEAKLEDVFKTGQSNRLLNRLKQNGVASFLVANDRLGQWGYFSTVNDSSKSWNRRWKIWSYYYLISWWLTNEHGINHLELDSAPVEKKLKVHFWSNAFSVAADAIHTATDDNNQLFETEYQAQIAAPGSEKNYFTDVRLSGNRGESRWGEKLFLRNQKSSWKHSSSEDKTDLFQVFAYQHFRWDQKLSKNLNKLDLAMKKHGQPMPVMLSKVNAISANYAAYYETDTHDPKVAGWFSEALIRLMKFNFHQGGYFISELSGDRQIKQSPGYDDRVKSNLNYLLWSEKNKSKARKTNNKQVISRSFGGITRSGEAFRMINKACPAGSILFESSSNLNGVSSLACRNPKTNDYHLLLVNNSNQMHSLRLRVPWDTIKAGNIITSSDISQTYAGQPTAIALMPWNKKITTPLLSQTIKLLSFHNANHSNQLREYKPAQKILISHKDASKQPNSILLRQQEQRQMLYMDFLLPKRKQLNKLWLKIKGNEQALTEDHVLHVFKAPKVQISTNSDLFKANQSAGTIPLDWSDLALKGLVNQQLTSQHPIQTLHDIKSANGLGLDLSLIATFQVSGDQMQPYYADISDAIEPDMANYQILIARVPRKRYQEAAEPAWQQQRFRFIPDSIRLIGFYDD
ncbi:hypothetical protein [Pelagibaculum spongiae]|nr:hypothetical protein [Pelagibaculum spongiae]